MIRISYVDGAGKKRRVTIAGSTMNDATRWALARGIYVFRASIMRPRRTNTLPPLRRGSMGSTLARYERQAMSAMDETGAGAFPLPHRPAWR